MPKTIMPRWTLIAVQAGGALLSSLALADYTVTDIGAFHLTSDGYSVNESGTVAGQADVLRSVLRSVHAVSFDGTELHDLGVLRGGSDGVSYGYGINSAGMVVGTSSPDGSFNVHAFVFDPTTGKMTDLGTLGGNESVAYGINDSNLIVGESVTAEGLNSHPFVYDLSTGVMTDLDTFGGLTGYATAINSAGFIAGAASVAGHQNHAFLYDPSLGEKIDIAYQGRVSAASGLNNLEAPQVVGHYSVPTGGTRAFLYDSASKSAQDLGSLPGDFESFASGINDSGIVVGSSILQSGTERPFIYDGVSMRDLNEVAGGLGWTFRTANAINNAGQIVGTGRNPLGENHGYLLTPTP
jgi:probable HAF family extracellular repeat protein